MYIYIYTLGVCKCTKSTYIPPFTSIYCTYTWLVMSLQESDVIEEVWVVGWWGLFLGSKTWDFSTKWNIIGIQITSVYIYIYILQLNIVGIQLIPNCSESPDHYIFFIEVSQVEEIQWISEVRWSMLKLGDWSPHDRLRWKVCKLPLTRKTRSWPRRDHFNWAVTAEWLVDGSWMISIFFFYPSYLGDMFICKWEI